MTLCFGTSFSKIQTDLALLAHLGLGLEERLGEELNREVGDIEAWVFLIL